MECVCFTLIVDDIVLPHGETVMEVLGGGGPQTLFGYQLVTTQSAAVGLSAGVGPDLPQRCKAWLESLGVDTSGLVLYQRPTPRAWQVFEEWGRRTQIWRGRDDPCEELYDMLRPKYDTMPPHFQRSCNYHLGVHPLHPPRRLMSQLRRAAHANGGVLSIEPYTAAESAATSDQVSELLAHCDIFSPNEGEAESIVGPGSPEQLALRLLSLSPPGGADLVVVRCGPEGVLVARRQSQPPVAVGVMAERVLGNRHGQQDVLADSAGLGKGGRREEEQVEVEVYRVPAVADTAVVDVTGCGNAFCGGFLAALYRGDGCNGSCSDNGGDACGNTGSQADRGGSITQGGSRVAAVTGRVDADDSTLREGEGQEGLRPSWVQTGNLRQAGAWGCVAASFMAEERGVPLKRVAELQDKANARLEALLPRVYRVQLTPAFTRGASCKVLAELQSKGTCAGTCRHLKPAGSHLISPKLRSSLGRLSFRRGICV